MPYRNYDTADILTPPTITTGFTAPTSKVPPLIPRAGTRLNKCWGGHFARLPRTASGRSPPPSDRCDAVIAPREPVYAGAGSSCNDMSSLGSLPGWQDVLCVSSSTPWWTGSRRPHLRYTGSSGGVGNNSRRWVSSARGYYESDLRSGEYRCRSAVGNNGRPCRRIPTH